MTDGSIAAVNEAVQELQLLDTVTSLRHRHELCTLLGKMIARPSGYWGERKKKKEPSPDV